jgi:hypothetical protein
MEKGGGLHIPDNLGIGEQVKKSIYKKWDTMEDIEAQLRAKGFAIKDKPSYDCPVVTETNLTKHGEDFTTLYAQVLGWFNYVSPMVAACRALSTQWENKKTIIEATLRKDMRTRYREKGEKVPSKEELEDEVHTDPDFQECLLEQQKSLQLKVMFDAYAETVYQSMKVVSRQVEINKQEFETGRANTNGRPHHQPIRGGQR